VSGVEAIRSTIAPMASRDAIEQLRHWIAGRRRVFVLTGAGCSTASGIPDYRDENGDWKRRPPVMILPFRTQEAVYRRYWARAYAGWPRFTAAVPSVAHHALAAWESSGTLACLVTQNVDGLHQRAGSRAVIDLHGRLDEVVCLGCGGRRSRESVQKTMAASNPAWSGCLGSQARQEDGRDSISPPLPLPLLPFVTRAGPVAPAPDGDADVEGPMIESFVPPGCDRCGGLLKPDVVFFGENVPARRVEDARHALSRADAVLVAGSSLMVYSGFRFVRFAHDLGLPIAIVNRGRTRGDDCAELKVCEDVGAVLSHAIVG
jgi:NAD-dependent SIR2 family protein deacetylase